MSILPKSNLDTQYNSYQKFNNKKRKSGAINFCNLKMYGRKIVIKICMVLVQKEISRWINGIQQETQKQTHTPTDSTQATHTHTSAGSCRGQERALCFEASSKCPAPVFFFFFFFKLCKYLSLLILCDIQSYITVSKDMLPVYIHSCILRSDLEAWGGSSVIKSTLLHLWSRVEFPGLTWWIRTETPIPGSTMSSSDLCGHQACM